MVWTLDIRKKNAYIIQILVFEHRIIRIRKKNASIWTPDNSYVQFSNGLNNGIATVFQI